jgi:hypothetical protein
MSLRRFPLDRRLSRNKVYSIGQFEEVPKSATSIIIFWQGSRWGDSNPWTPGVSPGASIFGVDGENTCRNRCNSDDPDRGMRLDALLW